MKKVAIQSALLCFLAGLIAAQLCAQDSTTMKRLSSAQIARVSKSVFEVVIKNPFDNPWFVEKKKKEGRESEIRLDPIVYAEDLPWDTLDFKYRTDAYISVGTAFSIGSNRFITAAHVLGLERVAQWNDFYIRDTSGTVFPLDIVYKYSNYRDFVEFSARGFTGTSALVVNEASELNSTVYAVGNALGEGIVIRNGLLTSKTKESENGNWDFLRFSAAASPGNSGGPLLNEDAEVIGIVLRKSQDENLNYALPMGELKAIRDNTASYHELGYYYLMITDKKLGPTKLDLDIALPLHHRELRTKLTDAIKADTKKRIAAFVGKYQKTFFPNGKGSYGLFHNKGTYLFPALTGESADDQNWYGYSPKETKTAQLDGNGYLQYGAISNLGSFFLMRPDTISLEKLFEDSSAFMKLFLAGNPLTRNFSGHKIRMVDIGKPESRIIHTDKYQRKWIIETWPFEFTDQKILVASLPTAQGRAGMYFIAGTHDIDVFLTDDMKLYLDHVLISYAGTFSQWREFLKLRDYLPGIFTAFDFFYSADRRVDAKTSALSISYFPDLFSISDKSFMVVKTGYYPEKNAVNWGITGLSFWKDENEKAYFNVFRRYEPEPSLSDEYKTDWRKTVQSEAPYNRVPFADDGDTYLISLHPRSRTLLAKGGPVSPIIYTLSCGDQGTVPAATLNSMLTKVEAAIRLR